MRTFKLVAVKRSLVGSALLLVGALATPSQAQEDGGGGGGCTEDGPELCYEETICIGVPGSQRCYTKYHYTQPCPET